MATQATLGSTNVLYNASEFFYNVNVLPIVACVAIDNNIGLPFKFFLVSYVLSCDDTTKRTNAYLPAIF